MSRRDQKAFIAANAERLLHDDVLSGILNSMEAKCVAELMALDMEADYGMANQHRDRAIIRLQETRAIRGQLHSLIASNDFDEQAKERRNPNTQEH